MCEHPQARVPMGWKSGQSMLWFQVTPNKLPTEVSSRPKDATSLATAMRKAWQNEEHRIAPYRTLSGLTLGLAGPTGIAGLEQGNFRVRGTSIGNARALASKGARGPHLRAPICAIPLRERIKTKPNQVQTARSTQPTTSTCASQTRQLSFILERVFDFLPPSLPTMLF